MNINEIRHEMKTVFNDGYEYAIDFIRNHGNPDYPNYNDPRDDYKTAALLLVDMAYKEGKNEAAKDPKTWYVFDRHGNHLHIGDIINSHYRLDLQVSGFRNGPFGVGVEWWDNISGSYRAAYSEDVERVIPDTKEKIKEELADIILNAIESGEQFNGIDPEASANLNADEFISRILKVWNKETAGGEQ